MTADSRCDVKASDSVATEL